MTVYATIMQLLTTAPCVCQLHYSVLTVTVMLLFMTTYENVSSLELIISYYLFGAASVTTLY